MHMIDSLLCFIVIGNWSILLMPFKVTFVTLEQSYNNPIASVVTLKVISKYIGSKKNWWFNHNKAELQNSECAFYGIYCWPQKMNVLPCLLNQHMWTRVMTYSTGPTSCSWLNAEVQCVQWFGINLLICDRKIDFSLSWESLYWERQSSYQNRALHPNCSMTSRKRVKIILWTRICNKAQNILILHVLSILNEMSRHF